MQARLDIGEIDDFTASRWGEHQAATYLRDLYAACERLADGSAVGRRRDDIPPAYLVYKVGSHLIVYRADSASDILEVLNILHPSMNAAPRVAAALRRLDS